MRRIMTESLNKISWLLAWTTVGWVSAVGQETLDSELTDVSPSSTVSSVSQEAPPTFDDASPTSSSSRSVATIGLAPSQDTTSSAPALLDSRPSAVGEETRSTADSEAVQIQPRTASGAETAPLDAEESLEPIPNPVNAGPVKIEAASFNGVIPGETTQEEVEQSWGAPKKIQKQGNLLIHLHSVELFNQVEVTYFDNKVDSVVIRFEKAFPAGAVAEQLGLTPIRPVLVSNELGEILGQVYPERGVLFAFAPSPEPGKVSMRVAQIILERITAEPFVLRAETNLDRHSELALKDLEHALKLETNNARAYWLRSRALLSTGDLDAATTAAGKAVELAPEDPQFLVTHAQALGQTGKLAEAVKAAQRAIEFGQSRPHIRARATCLLGDLLASGSQPAYEQAIEQHRKAVTLSDPLLTSRHPAVRIAAKEVMVDAHLGAAHDIAWGVWKNKEVAVSQWLDRAKLFAEDLVENERANEEVLFRVSTRALASCVGARGAMDPEAWTQDAVRVGRQLIDTTEDATTKARLEWDLGMALYDALQVYQMRDDHQTALKYGEWAIEYLAKGNQQRPLATTDYLLGRLYFRLGAIHAIRDQNHRAAITWFDKAIPLLKNPIPKEAFADQGRHGETFVSMGVSYWESGQRENGVALTKQGISLMERAYAAGTLSKEAMSVPYENLASMHRQLGRNDEAKRYEMLSQQRSSSSR